MPLVNPQVEEAQIIQDLTHPSVTNNPEDVKSRIGIYRDAYSATKNTHAIVLCTEWDEFIVSIIFFFFTTDGSCGIFH